MFTTMEMKPTVNFSYSEEKVFQTVPNERPSCMYSLPSPLAETPQTKFYRLMIKENVHDDIVSCKKRLDFTPQSYLPLHKPHTVAVARRNERERNRVKLINMTFATLRDHIPSMCKAGKTKKMSKVETLRAAIDYIKYLQDMVEDEETVSTALEKAVLPQRTNMSPSASVNSCTASSGTDSSYETLSADEEEQLIDFSNWF